jgi:hypothetical protein
MKQDEDGNNRGKLFPSLVAAGGSDAAAVEFLSMEDVPGTLGAAGAELWRSISAQYAVGCAGGRELLTQVCQAADRVAEMRAVIDREGLTVEHPRAGLKEHPLLRHELQARAYMSRTLQRLLGEPKKPVGRPTDQAIGPRSLVRSVKP